MFPCANSDIIDQSGVLCMQSGLDLANQIFSLSDSAGIPLSNLMAIKPNLTCTGGAADTIDGMGIRTDVPFLEGPINGIISTGFLPSNMYMRESNWMGDAYCAEIISFWSLPPATS